MIIFFRTKLLAQQLYTDSVPEFHKFLYLFLPFLSEYIVDFLPSPDKAESSEFILYLKLGVFIVGMITVWLINFSGDNQSFLDRFISLGFPAYIKINIISFLFVLLAPYIMMKLDLNLELYWTYEEIFLILNRILYFILIGYWMNVVSKNKFHFIR